MNKTTNPERFLIYKASNRKTTKQQQPNFQNVRQNILFIFFSERDIFQGITIVDFKLILKKIMV